MREWMVIAYAVMGLGCLIAVFGLLGRKNWQEKLDKERVRAMGTVVEQYEKTDGRRGAPLCRLIIGFKVDGVEHRAKWSSIVQAAQWPVGKEVELLFDPDHPENIHLAEEEGESPPNTVMRGGAILIACAVVAIVAMRLLSGGAPIPTEGEGAPQDSVFYGDTDRQKVEFDYALRENGSAEITRYSGEEAALFVPMFIDGHSVTGIRRAAFINQWRVEALTVPGVIKTIPMGAFAGCIQLREVELMDGVERIERAAFSGCTALSDVTLPGSLTAIADDAFPENCSATFHVVADSRAADWCAGRGFRFKAE